MAFNLFNKNPDAGAPETDFPTGKYLNKSAGIPGTPVLADMRNDSYIFFNRLIIEAGIVLNDVAETIGSSQFFNALKIAISGSGEAAEWDNGFTYANAGTLVRNSEGNVYSSTGIGGNFDKNPNDPANKLYWFFCKSNKEYQELAYNGDTVDGNMHPVHDRQSANYQQNLLVGKKTIDGVDYEEHFIHLDGTVVTGNGILEGLLLGYPYLDEMAPDNLGTRTLIDMASRHITPQSSGGDNDVLGEVLADRMQGFRQELQDSASGAFLTWGGVGANAGFVERSDSSGSGVSRRFQAKDLITDGVNGTPRIGSTTHSKEFTVGASYIIVQVAV
jgi:hypothetical protein